MTVFDPVTTAFWLRSQSDQTYKNLDFTGVFGLRSCTNIVIDGGQCGGTSDGSQNLVGATQGLTPSKNVTIRNVRFHDMTVSSTDQHHEALYVSCVDGITIDGCTFERIYGNTADLFFTGWEVPGNANHVTLTGCHFLPPTNGKATDAIQWNDVNGGFHDYLIEGNLFDGCAPNFGTLNKPVTNFVVGVNYGQSPSAAAVSHAKSLGVVFKELPFRPASEWPGATPAPTPTPIPDPTPPPTDPCADVKAQLADAQKQLSDMTTARDAALAAETAAEAARDQALADMNAATTERDALKAKIAAAVADLA